MTLRPATIVWRTAEQGGRKALPITLVYYATTTLAPLETGACEDWSIVVRFDRLLAPDELTAPCGFAFLAPKAPSSLPSTLKVLPVFEGPKQVAELFLSIP